MEKQVRRRIPFARANITEAEIQEVVDTLRSGWLTTGSKTVRFAEEFRAFIGARHALPVSSCTAALHLGLLALGVDPGAEVITSTFTFVSTATTILHAGARPVLVDVDERTLNMDPQRVADAVTPRTKAIIPVHFGGLPCDMAALEQVARDHNLRILEDAAHAFRARSAGRTVGTIGDATAFSFYATKNLTTGEGGMLTTNDANVAATVETLTLHGMSRDAWKRYTGAGSWWYDVTAPGYKYNLSDLQAAIGLHQLRRAEDLQRTRTWLAEAYRQRLERLPFVQLPALPPSGDEHAWHLFPIRLRPNARIGRDRLIETLQERGVSTSVHFIPVHMHSFYRAAMGHRPGDFPNAEQAYASIVSLPFHTLMTEDDVDYVVDQIREAERAGA
ncbi:MAG TPA: DegT/DnrJ/EryC1/StrS family aminotransferase [bacterium]|nr:DegT/DnrJ/EryC1/StrS family aminotransferase [bacterium]